MPATAGTMNVLPGMSERLRNAMRLRQIRFDGPGEAFLVNEVRQQGENADTPANNPDVEIIDTSDSSDEEGSQEQAEAQKESLKPEKRRGYKRSLSALDGGYKLYVGYDKRIFLKDPPYEMTEAATEWVRRQKCRMQIAEDVHRAEPSSRNYVRRAARTPSIPVSTSTVRQAIERRVAAMANEENQVGLASQLQAQEGSLSEAPAGEEQRRPHELRDLLRTRVEEELLMEEEHMDHMQAITAVQTDFGLEMPYDLEQASPARVREILQRLITDMTEPVDGDSGWVRFPVQSAVHDELRRQLNGVRRQLVTRSGRRVIREY